MSARDPLPSAEKNAPCFRKGVDPEGNPWCVLVSNHDGDCRTSASAEKDTRRLAYVIHEAVCTAYKHEGRNALCERAALAVLTSEFLDDYANAVLLDAAREWPTMTRDMVSRGHVRRWLEERAASVLSPGGQDRS